MKFFTIILLALMVGCSPSIHMPSLTKQAPDVLTNDTEVVVAPGVRGTINKGSLIQIPEEDKVDVVLQEKIQTVVNGKTVEIPKNTKVTIPANTYLKTTEATDIRLSEGADVTLRKGTVITISKINWYAILFYMMLIGGAIAYWIYSRNKDTDKDNDGYVDEEKPQQLNESER